MDLNTIRRFATKTAVYIGRRDILEYFVVSVCVIGIIHLFGSSPEYAFRQLLFAVIGLTLFYLVRFDFIRLNLKHLIVPFYILTLFMLGGVLFTDPIKGASRWFNVFGFSIQPSEFAKIASILAISYCVTYLRFYIRSRTILLILLFAIILIPSTLIFIQPDFGSAFLLAFTSFLFLLLVFRISKKETFVIVLFALLGVIFVFLNLKEFQKKRIISYLSSFNRTQEVQGNFNSVQAKIAIGSGGFWGKGLGSGTQSKLAFLPEDHTDFAFSSYAEQFGFAGVFILMTLIILTISFMVQSLQRSKFPVIRRALVGIIILFVVQIFVNISMNIGLLPIVGVPLPFISYGGSSLLIWFFMMGLF